jgi:hypothetical protein
MMGAWGPGSFENDSALDWVSELEQFDDLHLVVSTLEQAIDDDLIRYGDGFVDTNNVDTAIAAAESCCSPEWSDCYRYFLEVN